MSALVGSPVTVRLRRPTDSPFLNRLVVDAFGEYSPNGATTALQMVERLFTLVACRDGEPIGLASLEQMSPTVVALQALAVLERERGRGVGRRLLRESERQAAEWGARSLTLHTAEANVAALELFSKNGFVVERRLRRYYRRVFDAYLMVKSL